MPNINIKDLNNNTLVSSESFAQDLSDHELNNTQGGYVPILLIGAAFLYGYYLANREDQS